MNPDRINEKIEVFNYYFSNYCEKLYGEKYLFVYNNWKNENKFPVSLDYFKGNVGTGMKKGVIVAFDLAYMKYAQELIWYRVKSPRNRIWLALERVKKVDADGNVVIGKHYGIDTTNSIIHSPNNVMSHEISQ